MRLPRSASPGATVVDNIFRGNVAGGIGVVTSSTVGYAAGFKINPDSYAEGTPANSYDLLVDPLFVDADGSDGVLGGDGFEDDSFHLAQAAAGQAVDSPAVDFAPVLVEGSDVVGWSTRSDGVPDAGALDLGFHYGTPSVALEWLNRDRPQSAEDRGFPDFCYPAESDSCESGDCNGGGQVAVNGLVTGVGLVVASGGLEMLSHAETRTAVAERFNPDQLLVARDGGIPDFCPSDGPDPCEVGDCDGDGTVSVNELVAAVGIALGTVDPSACLQTDHDQDGYVTVDELIAAINAALGLAR
jgi:hypothetical protein